MELDTPETAMSNSALGNSNNFLDTNGATPPPPPPSGTNQSDQQTNGIIKSNLDTDVIRLIGQHLISLGMKQTVDQLLEESGLSGLDHPLATKFQQHILTGDWDRVLSSIGEIANYINGDKVSNMNKMQLIIAEQKFLELIEDNQRIKALKCLRLELTPLIEDDLDQIRRLATLLVCSSNDDVRSRANWPGKGAQSRQNLVAKIQRFISPLIMLPPKRLSELLSQAAKYQRDKCLLHIPCTESDTNIDLKSDHVCSVDKFPLQSKQELDNHLNEVWFCKFSNDGKKLATAGLGGKIKIWHLDPSTTTLTERTTLDCNCHSISCLSWSPNDVYLLACGSEDRQSTWLWNVANEEAKKLFDNQEEPECVTTCSWHPSGLKYAVGGIKGTFNIYDLDGNRVGGRDGVRVTCLSFLHKDSNVILASDSLNRIRSYAVKDMNLESDEEDILEERNSIMSFTLDKEDKYIAVNLVDQGIHLWDYKLRTLLRMFPGVYQRNFIIHSSFSSPAAAFLASGSEDGKVYIYNVNKDHPVAILYGHSRCVNCVSWNLKYPQLLASVSDDRVVRLWAPDPLAESKILLKDDDRNVS